MDADHLPEELCGQGRLARQDEDEQQQAEERWHGWR
jgi:hypothetical protein